MTETNDMAQSALAQAQQMSRATRRQEGRRPRRRTRADASEAGYSGPEPDARDPQTIGGLLEGLVEERGWQRPLSQARIFADWAALVGSEIAAHCSPLDLREGELRISAESTAWATQLRLISSSLLASLARELGPDVVRKVIISGPTGPSWKHGAWSVRGARGPRDTYG